MSEHQADDRPAKSVVAHSGNGQGVGAAASGAPDVHLKPKAPASVKAEPESAGAVYTCPMHPQIRQVGPGSCPICGMTLEPVEITAETGPNNELHDMSRRFWIGLVLVVTRDPAVIDPGADGRQPEAHRGDARER